MESDEYEVGLNEAGLGITVGDWQIGVTPSMSTDDRYDDPQTRERVERQEADEREARRRGESTPNPIGDLLDPDPPADPREDPVFRSIEEARRRLEPEPPLIIRDPLTGQPVILNGAPDPVEETPAAEDYPPGDYPLPEDDEQYA
jgi:hypothetical protein